jgi:predicted transcriptional regulator
MSSFERKKRNMIYRDKIEIISHVLEAANGGAIKTRIMYKAVLSYKQMKEYVNFLAEKGLLEYGYQQDVRIVRTTEKGLLFLDTYYRIQDIITEDNHQYDNKGDMQKRRRTRRRQTLTERSLHPSNIFACAI